MPIFHPQDNDPNIIWIVVIITAINPQNLTPAQGRESTYSDAGAEQLEFDLTEQLKFDLKWSNS